MRDLWYSLLAIWSVQKVVERFLLGLRGIGLVEYLLVFLLVASAIEANFFKFDFPIVALLLFSSFLYGFRRLRFSYASILCFIFFFSYNFGIIAFAGFDRAWSSMSGLAVALAIYVIVGNFFCSSSFRLEQVLLLFLSIILVTLLLEKVSSQNTRSSGLLFEEPSHLALFVSPLLVFLLIRRRYFYATFFGLAIYWLSPSATLLLVVVGGYGLWFCLCIRKTALTWLGAVVFCGLVGCIVAFDGEIQERLVGVLGGGKNLSSLVWLNGWSQIGYYLYESDFMGVGFHLMGSNVRAEDVGMYANDIYEVSGKYLNFNDGSFFISQLTSEFGFVGVVFFLYFSLKCITSIRRFFFNQSHLSVIDCFALAAFTTGLVGLFVRGFGYFSPGVILFVWSVGFLLTRFKCQESRSKRYSGSQ